MSIRVSRQNIEVLIIEDPTLRVSRQQTEVIGVEDPNLRVSRQQTEVLGVEDPNLRVSRQQTEVLGIEDPNLRVSRQYVEILGFKNFIVHVSRQQVEVIGNEDPNLKVSRQINEVLGVGTPNLRISRQIVEVMGPVNIFSASAFSIITFQHSVDLDAGTFNTEIYGTEFEANEYFSKRLHERVWSGSSPDKRFRALWAATRIIDALNFRGYKHSTHEILQENSEASDEVIHEAEASQFLEFPRDADTVVPEDIRWASYEIAHELLDGKDPELELETLGIVSQGYASVRTSYSRNQVPIEHIINGIPSPQSWRFLRPFLREDDAIVLSRIS